MVFVEFARSSYLQAFDLFHPAILEESLVVYSQVSFDTCWARNVARHEAALALGGDDHLTPRKEMEKYYLVDDRDNFIREMEARGVPVVLVDNEPEGEEHLIEQVAALYERLF